MEMCSCRVFYLKLSGKFNIPSAFQILLDNRQPMAQDVWIIYFILVIALFAPLLSSPYVISRSKSTKIKSDQIHCLMYLSSKVHRSSVHVLHCLLTGIAIQNEKKNSEKHTCHFKH